MKSMNKTCILHIGAPKTGSTALEKFLANNAQILSKNGWKYPTINIRGFGHHDLAYLVSSGYPDWATPQTKTLDELQQDLAEAVKDKEKIILSSEIFYLQPNPEGVAEILSRLGCQTHNVKIVVYVRRQDDIHISWYNQAIKAQGYTGSIKDSIKETHATWDYLHQLTQWSDVFGKENILVRPYQAEDMISDDICVDFASLVGFPVNKLDFPQEHSNTRINKDILEYQRLINGLPLSAEEKRRFHKQLMDLTQYSSELELFDDTPLLSIMEREEILNEYENSNRKVAQTFLNRDELFNNELPSIEEQSVSESGLTVEKLVCIFSWIMARKDA